MFVNMEKLTFDAIRNRQTLPHDMTKAQLWELLNTHLEVHDNHLVSFATRVPQSVATEVRRTARDQNRKVQDVVTEALIQWLETERKAGSI